MKPPLVLPVAEYAPDMPGYMGGQSDNIVNVIPRTPLSYGPLSSVAKFSTGLNARCQGAYFGLDSGGNVNGFAGDATNLYQLTPTATSWAIVSSSAGAYSIATEDQWDFTLFGTRIVATDFSDQVQSFLLGVDTKFSNLITTANPPKARHVAVAKSYLVLADTSDPIYGAQHQRVWWSRSGDPTKFDAPGSALATQYETGFQDLLGDGGWIKQVVGNLGTADIAVFMEHAIFRGVWVGAPAVFDFFPAQGVRGTPAGGSVAQLGAIAYYLGEDGFYAFDGTNSRPIGANKVDKTFYADLDQNYMGSISSAIDPINKLYIVAYPGAGHTGANCNKLLMYNWQLDRWSSATPVPGGSFELISRALSFGYTLDQIYTVLGYSLDTMPFILDSRVWTGGNLLLGLFDTTHSLNFFTGTPLAATVDTQEMQPIAGKVTRIVNSRPLVDGNAAPSVSIGTRNRQVDSISFGSAVPMNSLGTSPQRTIGRYIRGRITVPSASSWTHISGLELEGGAPAGVRY